LQFMCWVRATGLRHGVDVAWTHPSAVRPRFIRRSLRVWIRLVWTCRLDQEVRRARGSTVASISRGVESHRLGRKELVLGCAHVPRVKELARLVGADARTAGARTAPACGRVRSRDDYVPFHAAVRRVEWEVRPVARRERNVWAQGTDGAREEEDVPRLERG